MPARIYVTSKDDFATARSASLPAAARAAAEASEPTLTALEAPEREHARIAPVSSMRTHSVLVPPPSKPRTYFIETRIRESVAMMWKESPVQIKANLYLTESGILRLSSVNTPFPGPRAISLGHSNLRECLRLEVRAFSRLGRTERIGHSSPQRIFELGQYRTGRIPAMRLIQ